ncbi:MAG: Uma2 family endonuclease [Candidatus Ozemobacteraceae bacterium]
MSQKNASHKYPDPDSVKGLTYADYKNLTDNTRWEIIDGEAWDMGPAPSFIHQEVLARFFSEFFNFLKGKPCKTVLSPIDVFFPKNDEPNDEVKTVIQPDILVVCDEKKIHDEGIRGAPDLIIEIISPSSASRDHLKKKSIYERHGVKEYWLVHPVDKIVTVYKLGKDGFYGKPAIYDSKGKIKVGIFPELAINLREMFPM